MGRRFGVTRLRVSDRLLATPNLAARAKAWAVQDSNL
jgi:hypothetical protein